MATSGRPYDILNHPPDDDQGSEAESGLNYQSHCIARLCLMMARGHAIRETVCEYHEDVSQLLADGSLRLCQVKKRESVDALTIPMLKEAIRKLLAQVKYKNVTHMVIYAHGRPSRRSAPSLAGLIALLDRPEHERDLTWADDLAQYEEHLSGLLGLANDTVGQGLRLLTVDLSTMPHPDGIVAENVRTAADVVSTLWDVGVSVDTAERAYFALHRRVQRASTRAKQPRSVKSISADEARQLLRSEIPLKDLPAKDSAMLLDTNEKLKRGGLQHHLPYALERRMDARQAKFEMGLSSTLWQDRKDEIAVAWQDFRTQNVTVSGESLWRELRIMLSEVNHRWHQQEALDSPIPDFAEALFFDMLAVCEADFGG